MKVQAFRIPWYCDLAMRRILKLAQHLCESATAISFSEHRQDILRNTEQIVMSMHPGAYDNVRHSSVIANGAIPYSDGLKVNVKRFLVLENRLGEIRDLEARSTIAPIHRESATSIKRC